MSQQFNYFASNQDQKVVCETMFSTLGKMYIIPERGTKKEMVPHPILNSDELYIQNFGDFVCLVQEEFLPLIKLREIGDDLYRIEFGGFPCLEYSPCIQSSQTMVKMGRIVYFFNEVSPFQANVQKLMRVLKKKSLKLKIGGWIFEDAMKHIELLNYGVGQPKNNPMFVKA